jgi:hypothetical protein
MMRQDLHRNFTPVVTEITYRLGVLGGDRHSISVKVVPDRSNLALHEYGTE